MAMSLIQRMARRFRRFGRLRARHLRLGRLGENLACRMLTELGLDVLERNYRTKAGEIDIVARDGAVLCFIEVKTRHRRVDSRPADAVDATRRKRLQNAANKYRDALPDEFSAYYRFDIVEVIFEKTRLAQINYLRQAW